MHRFRIFSLNLVFLFIFLFLPLAAQDGDQYAEDIKNFEEFVKEQMAADRIPGLSVGFIKDDFVWTAGFGYADLENKCPAKAESAYRLASVTKPMTAVAILNLVEDGKIDLNAEVQTFVPYFPKKQWPVKVGQVLGHLGGISHYRNYDLEGHFKDHKDTREAIAVFEEFDLVAEPGTKYNYSSYGYNLLGAIIEGASGQSYGEYMHEHIWGPLRMDATRLDNPVDIIPNRVRGYRIIDGEVKNSEFVDISSRFAAGGTRSTVGDLLKFAEGMVPGKILNKETLNMMWTSMAQHDGYFTNYGRGWAVSPVNGRFRVLHGGAQAETRTRFVYYPKENFAIAVACNLEGTNLRPYTQKLYQLILDAPWDINAYTGSQRDDVIYRGMKDVFDYGLSYYVKNQVLRSEDAEELASAFEFFNNQVNRKALEADFEGTLRNVRNGRHPIGDEAFVKVGSFMASKLVEKYGWQRLPVYHDTGATLFFNDYIEMYTSNSNISKSRRFTSDFEMLVNNWHQAWAKVWTEDIKNLDIGTSTDFGTLGKKLKTVFLSASIYPNFVEHFMTAMQQLYVQGDGARGFQAAKTAYELYPNSDETNAYYGIGLLTKDNQQQAKTLIKKAAEMNPRGAASARNLNRIAYQMARIGLADYGMTLLKIAAELHPQVANLYDSIGEFYLNKGQIEESVAYYNKALEIDPEFENAKRMLKKIKAEHPSVN
ncbi:serine hydrolase [candidate division KSB1 bacterium]|nr:serine hydrolase [candidate division KSB1 bacterium]NIR73036.1 serine hydrolase [candidate division KSB1 bacterium]NIS23816.1 serine hydrolase [candidate division KSB1 bacterium]NIT70743.1 serine hydrolase [candidate division KSB1 bacterium]NIU24465.1 serine hydrolase [candidate division KSB1 bacterium]